MALSKTRRFEVFKRDGFTCQYCGRRPDDGTTILEVDHIHPRAEGGTDDELNLITSCADCNRGKRAKLLAEVAPRPDADIRTLQVQQEAAEIRRYQAALDERERLLIGLITDLQDLWTECAGDILDWHPATYVLRQFLGRYPPEMVEAAIRDVAPKVAGGYVSDRSNKWVPYMWSVMRNLQEEEDAEDMRRWQEEHRDV